jgi:hypothetical protein
LETIKWSIDKDKFEIHQGLCVKFELQDIITYCITVVHKVDGQVGDNNNKKLQLNKQVLPRTLSILLAGVWEQVVAEMEDEDQSLKLSSHFLHATLLKMIDMSWSAPSATSLSQKT